MRDRDWLNIEYLAAGTSKQQAAFQVLKQLKIFEHLREFYPVLVGTIPLDIDIPGSDLDILCEVNDFAPFAALIQNHFGHRPEFHQKTKTLNGVISHVSRFLWELKGEFVRTSTNSPELVRNTEHEPPIPIEIVAQPVPVTQQRAYLHMLAEAHLLEQGGEPAQEAIRALKLSGIKTEPAFGQYFHLVGDPYQALLKLGKQISVTQYPISDT